MRRGIGLCIDHTLVSLLVTHRESGRRYNIMQCDAGISHHHTAAAAALTRSIEPVLLLLWLCQFFNRPNTLPCSWTHRQTDRHSLSAKICSVLKSCISDSSINNRKQRPYCLSYCHVMHAVIASKVQCVRRAAGRRI